MDPELIELQRIAEENGLKTADKVAPPPSKFPSEGTELHTTSSVNTSQGCVEQGSVDQNKDSPFEYVDETPKRPRRTEDEVQAEKELDHHWVALIGLERPAPRFFGDNRGMWPLHVERQADWRRCGLVYDHQQPALRAIRLAVIGCNSKANAERLKAFLDEALCGRQETSEAEPLRYRFRNGVDFGPVDAWWLPIMQDALVQCELASASFEVFTRQDHDRMVKTRAKAIMMERGRF